MDKEIERIRERLTSRIIDLMRFEALYMREQQLARQMNGEREKMAGEQLADLVEIAGKHAAAFEHAAEVARVTLTAWPVRPVKQAEREANFATYKRAAEFWHAVADELHREEVAP